jgi:hypothetical protein
LDYIVLGPDQVIRVRGHTIVAMIGLKADEPDHFRPVRIPRALRERIESFISAVASPE